MADSGATHKQTKPVIIYTVVANNTDDVYLNSHVFKKAEMHHVFHNTAHSMHILFEGGQDDEQLDCSNEGEKDPVIGHKCKAGDAEEVKKRKVYF